MPEQELREHEQMTVSIEKIRADIKAEQRKITLQTYGVLIASFAAGMAPLALLNSCFHH